MGTGARLRHAAPSSPYHFDVLFVVRLANYLAHDLLLATTPDTWLRLHEEEFAPMAMDDRLTYWYTLCRERMAAQQEPSRYGYQL